VLQSGSAILPLNFQLLETFAIFVSAQAGVI
jgi:hypothetical protein